MSSFASEPRQWDGPGMRSLTATRSILITHLLTRLLTL